MKRLVFVSLVLCLSAFCAQAVQVSGVVFHDLNGNGVRDPGEPGIPDVAVSNGDDVALTDADGNYTLEVWEHGAVFVIKPSGWSVPVDPETQIGKFFYVHRPEGSPPLKFGGVAATGALPESVDFALQPRDESAPLRMIALGDTQVRDQREVDYMMQDLVSELVDVEADFGFTLGDIVFDGLHMFDPLIRGIAQAGIPWHHVPGNHDMDFDAPTWEQTFETYQNHFGPPYYAFAQGKVHVFVLNNIRWSVEERKYHAEFGERQLRFVENYLRHVPRDHFLVLLMHIPLTEPRDKADLFKLIADYPHCLSLSAHWHRHEHFFLGAGDGWPGDEPHHHIVHGTACGAWYRGRFDAVGIPEAVMADGTPKGYSILVVGEDNTYDLQYRATRRPASYQMDIHAPAKVSRADLGTEQVVVNFFNGSERCRLEMRLNDGPWMPMERFFGQAPFYVELYERQNRFLHLVANIRGVEEADEQTLRRIEEQFRPVMGRGMPGIADTNHLWRASLPDTEREGFNVIEVRAHDLFGNTHFARRYIQIVE